ncbi:hypothetical protein [Streptomyces rapamycinicus]|uniref:Ig-like domain-containing protein n=2 Tax=Streptomyces rapamycinicus TaxID=1226757 RepID=A0A3L8RGA0_STRRN|nr:hypothetical protein [Streptomyces rapamycinicus]MBB4785898.1 hypothetical protein [Streptomyces rapamycinicus]RLV78641.1 hypothetical protein D3C57_109690 [Streptomyces rapamycinicus NRRL 5491]UTO66039.1 hypothetical protein LJB45_29435 [Streptomyces rapamycinicus]UTP33993.1 hypothetical protein LIV37_34565 [Streptomyces rapamycinicus NRRL 5491]
MSARRMLTGTFLGLGALALAATAVAPAANAAPVPVTSLNCDGDTYTCTAGLRFGDGRWVAQWNVNVFHQSPASQQRAARSADAPRGAAAPVPVTTLTCDGDTYKCTAGLQFGDGRWVAQWNANVFHQAMANAVPTASAKTVKAPREAAAPVPVTALNCDGDTYKCTAGLQFGDGRWVAQWDASVFHQS